MKNFIKITRQDRNHEIINYETKGYCFINKNDYALIDKIQVNYYGYCMDLRIRVGCQEPSFLLINEGANIELSLTTALHELPSIKDVGPLFSPSMHKSLNASVVLLKRKTKANNVKTDTDLRIFASFEKSVNSVLQLHK